MEKGINEENEKTKKDSIYADFENEIYFRISKKVFVVKDADFSDGYILEDCWNFVLESIQKKGYYYYEITDKKSMCYGLKTSNGVLYLEVY